jgi:hypothetical protein
LKTAVVVPFEEITGCEVEVSVNKKAKAVCSRSGERPSTKLPLAAQDKNIRRVGWALQIIGDKLSLNMNQSTGP